MKIFTRVEYRWDAAQGRYVVLSAEYFDYVGPIARCDDSGGGADPSADTSSDSGDKGGGNSQDTEYAPQDIPTADDTPSPDTTSGESKIPAVLKDAGDVATKTLAQAGVLAGVQALSNRGASSQADAFNKQLSGLVSNANNQSYNSAQAVPITPGLSGSTPGAKSPTATVANMNLPAPVSSTSSAAAGTQAAPSSPSGAGQTGAIKLGVRPQVYA